MSWSKPVRDKEIVHKKKKDPHPKKQQQKPATP